MAESVLANESEMANSAWFSRNRSSSPLRTHDPLTQPPAPRLPANEWAADKTSRRWASMRRKGATALPPGEAITLKSLNGRVTQAEVDALKNGLGQALTAIENNLVAEVYGETLPLVGRNYQVAWSNNVPGFRYLTTLRSVIVTGLGTLTNAADYSTTNIASAINTRLTSAGFNAGSQVAVTTANNDVQLAFATSDTFPVTNVLVQLDFGLPNLDLNLLAATNCQTVVTGALNFVTGVDGSGFYLETAGAVFQVNTRSTISNLNTAVRFTRLPYRLTDNSTNRTTVPAYFTIMLKDANDDGQLRLHELAGTPDLLDATVAGNTRMSFKLLSSLPSSALLPQVGTDLRVQWNFTPALVNPDDDNSAFGNPPTLVMENNRMNLDSFFNSFANKALREIDRTTEPLQPLIDVLTTAIPVLSDLGSDDVTIMHLLGVDDGTVSAIEALDALLDLSALARSYTNNTNVYVDLGSYGFVGDLRSTSLEDLTGGVTRPVSTTRDADLNDFMGDANGIFGLSFPLLTDANVMANLLLGREATLFTWQSAKIDLSTELEQFYPVLGPVGITLGCHIGVQAQFGFGYDTTGIFDYYLGGSTDSSLLANGFFGMALDANGQALTGITLEAGLTAGIEANLVVASVGVEGDITARIGMYLDDYAGDELGRVRFNALLNTPLDELFYAAGSLSAGLRAYLEIGFPPFAVSYDIESPRVVLISFDSRDPQVPVLAEMSGLDLVLNIGDRASRRVYRDTDDRAEEYVVRNGSSGGISVEAFNATNDFATPLRIVGNGSGFVPLACSSAPMRLNRVVQNPEASPSGTSTTPRRFTCRMEI
jgi:hypothetical protein